MAVRGLIYATSFEHGSTTVMGQEGWDASGCTINTTNYHAENGVGEPHSVDIDGASASSPRTPARSGSQRFACWLRAQGTAAKAGFLFESAGSAQCWLELQTDGALKVYRGDDVFGTLLDTSASVMDRSVPNWIAVECVAANSGTLTVRVNGLQVYTYSGDLQALGSPGWDRLRLRTVTFTSDHTIDNLLVFDDSSSWLPGPMVAQVKLPSSVVSGTLTGSSATGADRWQNVDVAGDQSVWNETAAAGDGDLYGADALDPMGSVLAVVVCVEAERAGGITTIEPAVSVGGTTDYATAQGLPASGFGSVSGIWEENPDTAAAWSATQASAADLGARFQA